MMSKHTSYDAIFADWAGRGSSHVDFKPDEKLPLEEGRMLGHGAQGAVFEARCQGVTVAVKRRLCRSRITAAERREIDILKKLSHIHIVRHIGTFTHRRYLGILLFPVAACDLAMYMEDVESFSMTRTIDSVQRDRFSLLGLSSDHWEIFAVESKAFLLSKLGCLTTAIEYLHRNNIRHKDLKPSNVLLSADNLWVTDFGTSTDFSLLSTSITDNGRAGSPRYFAPEVAQYLPNGRSSDIFSLGCIFLEVVTSCHIGTLKDLQSLRPDRDGSYQANLAKANDWLGLSINDGSLMLDHLRFLTMLMLRPTPKQRPTAKQICDLLATAQKSYEADEGISLFGSCCRLHLQNLRSMQEEHTRRLAELEEQQREQRREIDEANAALEKERIKQQQYWEELHTAFEKKQTIRQQKREQEHAVWEKGRIRPQQTWEWKARDNMRQSREDHSGKHGEVTAELQEEIKMQKDEVAHRRRAARDMERTLGERDAEVKELEDQVEAFKEKIERQDREITRLRRAERRIPVEEVKLPMNPTHKKEEEEEEATLSDSALGVHDEPEAEEPKPRRTEISHVRHRSEGSHGPTLRRISTEPSSIRSRLTKSPSSAAGGRNSPLYRLGHNYPLDEAHVHGVRLTRYDGKEISSTTPPVKESVSPESKTLRSRPSLRKQISQTFKLTVP